MGMHVTYRGLNDEGGVVIEREDTSCFDSISDSHDNDFTTLEVKIKWSNKTRAYINFWLDLMKEIEPNAEFYSHPDDGSRWVRIPYSRGRHGKMLIFVTVLRYLWHSEYCYDDIVIMTKRILKLHPKMDKLKAVLLANSCTHSSSGWGHSLVNAMASEIKGLWHYRRYTYETAMGFASNTYGGGNERTLTKLRSLKKDRYDVEPVLEHYNMI